MTSDDKVSTTIRLPPDLYKWLREEAYLARRSQNSLVERGLRLMQAYQATYEDPEIDIWAHAAVLLEAINELAVSKTSTSSDA